MLDPADDGRYRLGILCEEGEQAPHPLESHVHVPRVLDARAWRFLAVDGRGWERDRERVLKRIGDAMAAACRMGDRLLPLTPKALGISA